MGGIYLGESVADVNQFCQERGIKCEPNQMRWDERWKLYYLGMDGRITFLILHNLDMLENRSAKEISQPRKR